MKSALKIFLALAFFVALTPTAVLAGEDKKQSVSITIGDDFYGAGNSIALPAEAADDAFMAGAIVNATKKVAHDLFAAGSSLTILSEVGDDLRAVGSVVSIAAPIGGDAVVAGGVLDFTENASVAGDAVLAGGMLDFAGSVAGDVELAGGEIVFGGTVGGDATIRIDEKISFLEGAQIGGKLTYYAKKELEIPAGIAASVEYQSYDKAEGFTKNKIAAEAVSKFFMLILGFVAGAVLLVLFGKASEPFANKVREKFWWSLLAGVVTLFVPLLAIIFAITVVGAWLGAILFLAWALGMLITGAFVGFTVGSLLIRQKKDTQFVRKLLTLALGWIVFLAVGFIPGFGGILQFMIFTLTLGTGVLTKFELYKKMKTAKLL
ncbi:MAG: hypothetical protein K9L85_01535 [Candidatus Peribacteraceae bacterium]|nr:hypothetical protein [Candidatus Peribacteraceae bacterium]